VRRRLQAMIGDGRTPPAVAVAAASRDYRASTQVWVRGMISGIRETIVAVDITARCRRVLRNNALSNIGVFSDTRAHAPPASDDNRRDVRCEMNCSDSRGALTVA